MTDQLPMVILSTVLTAIDCRGHVCALATYSQGNLKTSQVPVRDTRASIKFELSCIYDGY